MKGNDNSKKPQEAQESPPVIDPDEAVDEAIKDEPVPEEEEETETESPEVIETDYAALFVQAQDRYQRNLAEFDNFRKRTTKEMAARYEDGIRAAVEKLLPIIDNFERAMSASENKEDNFYQGVALIARQFDNMLSDMGVEPIGDGVGSVFDHNIHHAVAHIEDETQGQNVVTEVLQRGYMHRDKVLRPSMVKVAN